MTGRADTAVAAGALSSIFGGKSDADAARVNDAIGKLARMGEDAERAEKAARASGRAIPGAAAASAVDMNAALNAVGQIVSGGKDVHTGRLSPAQGHAARIDRRLKRTRPRARAAKPWGSRRRARPRTTDGNNGSIQVEISDLGSLSGLAGLAASSIPAWRRKPTPATSAPPRSTASSCTSATTAAARSGEVNVILNNRFNVTISGSGVDVKILIGALREIDISKLATMTASK